MFGTIAHFTPPAHTGPPYWRCCDVYGAPGETVCWACPPDAANTAPEATGPALHTSTGPVGRHEFPANLPDVDHLIERTRP